MNHHKRNLFILLILSSIINACHNYIQEFINRAEGTYTLTIDPNTTININNRGDMSGTPSTQLFFYQAKSETEAIYLKKTSTVHYYVPIKIDGLDLLSNTSHSSANSVSFNNMILFANKIY